MTVIVDDATRIRIIRAYLGMDCKTFSATLGICTGTLTNWEKGRKAPGTEKRDALARLCKEFEIAFSPSGYPFPVEDCVIFKEETNAGSCS